MADCSHLQAPFPWFGGKSQVADIVWERFGDVTNYVEPFFGSGAVMLGRPHELTASHVETINDKDGYVANFWRAVKHDPDGVARWADNPVNENDLHARHVWLVTQKAGFVPRLEGDPDFYCVKTAGWWVWGLCCWIGSGFCSGDGPWQVQDRQRVHLGDKGRGVNRQLVHLGNKGRGESESVLVGWMRDLAARLRLARVCSGDWRRVCTPTVTEKHGVAAVFLDPPYSVGDRADVYSEESFTVAHDVRAWAIENGDNPDLRICLAGYDTEHAMPDGWEVVRWKAKGGYGGGLGGRGDLNSHRETLWFSPGCLSPDDDRQGLLW